MFFPASKHPPKLQVGMVSDQLLEAAQSTLCAFLHKLAEGATP